MPWGLFRRVATIEGCQVSREASAGASNRETYRTGRGCHQGLLQTRRYCSRPVLRQRHYNHRGGANRPQSSVARNRPRLCRCRYPPLGAIDRQIRDASTGGTFEEITEQRTVELDFAQVEAVASLAGENHVVSPLKPPAPKSLGAARNLNQANRAIRLAVPDANSI